MKVCSLQGSSSFLCSVVYASPHQSERRSFWSSLSAMAESIFEPWLIAGDFNSLLDGSERVGGVDRIRV